MAWPYPQLGLLEVMQRQGLQVVGTRIVLHHRQLDGSKQVRAGAHPRPSRPPRRLPPPGPSPTLASLKLRSRASRLAPASCTLAIDMTLPKKEKEATSSSFSRCSRWAFPSEGQAGGSRSGPAPQPPQSQACGQGSRPCAHLCSCHSWLVPGREEEGEQRSHTPSSPTSWGHKEKRPCTASTPPTVVQTTLPGTAGDSRTQPNPTCTNTLAPRVPSVATGLLQEPPVMAFPTAHPLVRTGVGRGVAEGERESLADSALSTESTQGSSSQP